MELPFIMVGLWLGFSALIAHILVRRYQDRWSTVPACVALPEGAVYGSWGAGVAPSVPISVRLAAIFSIAWGIITGLIFAPAGLVYLAIAFEKAPLSAAVMVPVVLHGFVIAVRLCGASKELLTRDRISVRQVVRASWMHHLAVVLGFALSGNFAIFAAAAVPCLFGFGITGLLAHAGGRLPAEDQGLAPATSAPAPVYGSTDTSSKRMTSGPR